MHTQHDKHAKSKAKAQRRSAAVHERQHNPDEHTTSEPATNERAAGQMALRATHDATRLRRYSDAIGLLGLGLGMFGLLAPGRVARLLGAKDCAGTRRMIALASLGQVTAGVGALTQRRLGPWLWTRVASDTLDLAMITHATHLGALPLRRAVLAGTGFAGVALLVARTSLQTAKLAPNVSARSFSLNVAITIQRTPHEVYHAWRDLQSFPRFMSHVESVQLEGGSVRFRARLPAGVPLEWEVKLTDDIAGSRISWESTPESALRNHGTVTFVPAPGNRGTEMRVSLHYEPPAGALGQAFMKLSGALPREQIRADLRRFKQILETGSVMHSDASVHAGPHPARPEKNA